MKTLLRVLRAEQERSQEELARRVGVSRQTICAIEIGRYNPNLRLAIRIARAFRKAVEEVFLYDPHVTGLTRQPRSRLRIHTRKESHAH